jgi:hypothetical protein
MSRANIDSRITRADGISRNQEELLMALEKCKECNTLMSDKAGAGNGFRRNPTEIEIRRTGPGR